MTNSMHHAPVPSRRYILACNFRDTASRASRADLSLDEWVLIDTDDPLRAFKLVIDPDLPRPPAS
jgi:hypothetical protein